ncbi:phage tail domain-containing protein [Lactobacillus sp. 3B(2020)]|uniref:phage tail domain-containing protein n=1 Tax=Lactobacillus sp. 3B(2020) TaxID=2695882 RepID=UPI0015DDA506|nr:phage tail domain-containing protein [Lactobacillus sp. 3B(2020)]QLL69602.1 phage tail family protein [Lactobacillus sp. 3B(2020)]
MIQVFSTRTDRPHKYEFGEYQNQLGFNPIEFSISEDSKKWTSWFDQINGSGVYCYQAPDPQPANPINSFKKIGIADGQQLLSTSYDTREFKMEVMCTDPVDEKDGFLAFDELQRFLVARDPYWISFSSWPGRMYYVKAKLGAPTYYGDRWLCEVTFTDLIGLSRSVEDTMSYDGDTLTIGNRTMIEDSEIKYSFTESKFKVYNFSDVMIDPDYRGHPFKLTLDGSSTGNLSITNKTTGDVLTRKDAFNGQFVLDGVNPLLNGKGDLLATNAGVITLQIGANDFEIQNFTGTAKFEFAMWWLS